ncbi:MAG: PASTA domain-containing protein [Acidimicrobiia bacterium]
MRVALCVPLLAAAVACSSAVLVPDGVGQTESEAIELMTEAGYDVAVQNQDGVPVGQVIRQQPQAGAEADPGQTTITLVVTVSPINTLTGMVHLFGSFSGTADDCAGTGDFSDLRAGLPVVVRDEVGGVLGQGQLEQGSIDGERCDFAFEVAGIPWAISYSIEVGERIREPSEYLRLQMAQWHVDFNVGTASG